MLESHILALKTLATIVVDHLIVKWLGVARKFAPVFKLNITLLLSVEALVLR
jgi:hypothetical protein